MEGRVAWYVLIGQFVFRRDVDYFLNRVGTSIGLLALSEENQWGSVCVFLVSPPTSDIVYQLFLLWSLKHLPTLGQVETEKYHGVYVVPSIYYASSPPF